MDNLANVVDQRGAFIGGESFVRGYTVSVCCLDLRQNFVGTSICLFYI